MTGTVTFEKLNANLVRVQKNGEHAGFIRRHPGLNWIADVMGTEAADNSVSVVKAKVRASLNA